MTAFKFNKVLAHKLPQTRVSHYFKTVVVPGKEEFELYLRAAGRSTMIPYRNIREITAEAGEGGRVALKQNGKIEAYDMVVLMPALVSTRAGRELSQLLEVTLDNHGFCEELHGRVDATKSKNRGVYLAGTCQAPMDLGKAMTHGAAAAGMVMASLVPGRKLALEAIHAEVDADLCSGCRSCLAVCPYKAISFDTSREVAEVSPIRCVGCGTCVAACPAGVIKGKHFSNEQIFAEIEGLLA
jgi:heterodisulfide reductase subunit A